MKFALLLLFTVFSFLAKANGRGVSRIIGGKEARIGQFPFVTLVTADSSSSRIYCGGALVSEEWVLTSGVCTHSIVFVDVTLGSLTLQGDDANRTVSVASAIVPHPDFNQDTLENDIGLIKLGAPVKLSDNIQPIKLASMNLPSILKPTAIGWGQTSDDDVDYSNELKYAQLNLLTNEECKETYGDQITDNMVCARGSNSEGACFGDGGGPLVLRPLGSSSLEHVGVTSFFAADGCELNPAGFTRTYSYVGWIKSVTGIA